MKHMKAMQLKRGTKMQPNKSLDKDAALKSKLNHQFESTNVSYPRQRSSDSVIVDKNLNKKGSSSKEEVGIAPPKDPVVHTLIQSPKRNGLSPHDRHGDKEDEVRKLQLELEQQLQIGNANRIEKQRSQAGALKQMNRPNYSCSSCGAIFHIKSLLAAHRRTHEDEFEERLRERQLREQQNMNSKANTTKNDSKQCRFCDRIFDLERALRIHQMCHCTKITPQQRRKLGYTDLAHEKKNTPLPKFVRQRRGRVVPLNQPVPDPNMPHVALGPAALKMIEKEQLQLQQRLLRAKRRSAQQYTIRAAGPMGRWR